MEECMIEMDFVTFEIAKKLKEKGYPQRTFGKYDMQGACYIEDGRFYENGCITEVERAYTSPTISQVLKWLREEKKIFVHIDVSTNDKFDYFFTIAIQGDETWEIEYVGEDDYNTYEEAATDGIEYVLDNLI